jgi:hypothetical protein
VGGLGRGAAALPGHPPWAPPQAPPGRASSRAHFLQNPYKLILRDCEIHPTARRGVGPTAPRSVGIRGEGGRAGGAVGNHSGWGSPGGLRPRRLRPARLHLGRAAASSRAHFLQNPYKLILRDCEIHPTARRGVGPTAPRSVGIRRGDTEDMRACPGPSRCRPLCCGGDARELVLPGTSPRRPSSAAAGPIS